MPQFISWGKSNSQKMANMQFGVIKCWDVYLSEKKMLGHLIGLFILHVFFLFFSFEWCRLDFTYLFHESFAIWVLRIDNYIIRKFCFTGVEYWLFLLFYTLFFCKCSLQNYTSLSIFQKWRLLQMIPVAVHLCW